MTKASNQRRKSRLQRRAAREEGQRRSALIEQKPMGFGAEISERVIDAIRTTPQKLRETPEDRYMFAAGVIIAECLRFNVAETNADAFFEINRDPIGDNAPIYSIRVTIVGEALFALRSSPGFEEMCRRLRKRDFSAAFYELFCAKIMHEAGLSISASPESGVRGADFDFSATQNDLTINCEVTSFDPVQYSSATVRNALLKKRKQLPEDKPAVVFCFCPAGWLEPNNVASIVEDAFSTFARSKRINAIVFLSEKYVDVVPGQYGVSTFPCWPLFHQEPRHPTNALEFLLTSRSNSLVSVGDGLDDIRQRIGATRQKSEFYRWVDELFGIAVV